MALDYQRALSALNAIDPGANREQWIQIGMAAKAEGLSLDDFTNWSRNAANFGSDKECANVWHSFKDGPISGGTLYWHAHQTSWKDPGRTHQNGIRANPAPLHTRPADSPQKRLNAPLIKPEALWTKCLPATIEHPYIASKRGSHEGLRIVPDDDAPVIAGTNTAGWLVVPATSPDGTLRTLQLIPPPGEHRKLNLPGHSFADGVFYVGEPMPARRLFIVEGIGQAWACWRATGDAAAVTFGAGRMASVSETLRKTHPEALLVVVPDRGKEADAKAIARKVGGLCACIPEDKPHNYDANDFERDHGTEQLAELLEKASAPTNRYRLRSADELLRAPPLRWLVRSVLPAEGLACIYGASGSGKSFLALDLCAAIASGNRWFGYRVNPAPVVYVALEGEAGFGQRVKAWKIHHGSELPEPLRFVMQAFDLRKPDDLQAMTEAVIASGRAGGLLVIDTLNRAASGADENTSRDMGEIIDAAKSLQSQLSGLVLMVHHSGKDQSRGLRGHSSLIAALDASIEVNKLDGIHEWRIGKAKDGTDDTGQRFRLQVVEVGEDDEAELITSCVVVADTGGRELRRALPPKSGTQKIVFDALVEVLRKDGKAPPSDSPATLPRGRPVVPVEHAIAQLRGRLLCEPKRRTERTQQALTALHARGLIGIDGGYLWKP